MSAAEDRPAAQPAQPGPGAQSGATGAGAQPGAGAGAQSGAGAQPGAGAQSGATGAGAQAGAGQEDLPAMWSRERVVHGWSQLGTLPNLLTLVRILLIPVFWVLLMYDDGQNDATRVAATLVFILASATDYLDGYLARRQGLVTTFGKIADPMADKALTGVALIGLSVLGELWWWVTVVIIVREVGVTVVRFLVLSHGVIPASRGGKLKTIFQMIGIVGFLLPITSAMSLLWWARNAVMAVAVVLTLVTGADYLVKADRTRRASLARNASGVGASGS